MVDEGSGLTPPILTLKEACDALPSPWAREEYSAACGQPWLAVALEAEHDAAAIDALREVLPTFPCPTLAVVPDGAAPAARSIARAFDAVVEREDELPELVTAIERSPLASCALVQLLRGNETRGIEEGLVAESFVYSTLQSGPEFARWLAAQPTLRPRLPVEPPVRMEREGARLELVLDHPARRNAYSAAMRDALCEGLQLALRDDSIEQVVLCGNGPVFCAGGDLDEFGLLADPATAHAIRTTRSAARLLAAVASKLRAELHGACVGAGIELPAFASHVVAREEAFFQLPEVAMGLVPGAGGTVSLPGRIGRQRTVWMALTGQRIDLERARAWGLVDAVETP